MGARKKGFLFFFNIARVILSFLEKKGKLHNKIEIEDISSRKIFYLLFSADVNKLLSTNLCAAYSLPRCKIVALYIIQHFPIRSFLDTTKTAKNTVVETTHSINHYFSSLAQRFIIYPSLHTSYARRTGIKGPVNQCLHIIFVSFFLDVSLRRGNTPN